MGAFDHVGAEGTRRPGCTSLYGGGLGQRLELAPQLLDLVPQLGGVLEAELLGRREHLLLERDRELLHLGPIQALDLRLPATTAARHRRRLEREELRDVGDALGDVLRRDPVRLVVGELSRATPIGLVDGELDRLRHLVAVEQHPAVDVPRRPADRLDERRLAAQESLLVRVEHGDERDFRQVQALAQEVDADEDVVLPEAKLADDLDSLQGVDLRVEIPGLHARFEQVVREVLRHLLGQRRHEHALAHVRAAADLAEQVVDLVLRRAQLDLGVDDAGGPDQLLADDGRIAQLVRAGSRGDEDRLSDPLQELVEAQRPVVERRREPEAEVDERLLPGAITLVHASDLRHGLMRLVDEAEEVGGEIVEQRVRRRPRGSTLEHA